MAVGETERGAGGRTHSCLNDFAPGRSLNTTRCPAWSVNTASAGDTIVIVPD
jgi:hypothetical protein